MKRMPLQDAITRFVRPGQHLNFASTPSRSNASIRAVAREFRGKHPDFVFSTTGFHSAAHLLGMLRLGRRYIGCFFGDNYPTPRPNALYQRLLEEGAELQHWSLWTYVSALRAAAQGDAYAITRPLSGTTLGDDLARAGHYYEVTSPLDDAASGPEPIGLLKPLIPDVTFLHAPLGDSRGYAWFSPPYSEGFHGALAAREGVILTVDAFTDAARIEEHPELIPIPPHRVLAICEAPFGAHPQPVHFAPALSEGLSYDDDYEHYRLWREMATDAAKSEAFLNDVLTKDDPASYQAFVGATRLETLRGKTRRRTTERPAASSRAPSDWKALDEGERQVVLAARAIAERVEEAGYRSILAGIGVSFAAARLAKRLLEVALPRAGSDVELMVETGFTGFGESSGTTDSYLLSRANIVDSRRLTGIESVLGTLVTGRQNSCLGVIGCAEVDGDGNVNSTFAGGKLLVGSGGACDIALGAKEVFVLARADRLVQKLAYVTSPGRAVTHIVTEGFILKRIERRSWAVSRTVDLHQETSSEPSAWTEVPWNGIATNDATLVAPLTSTEWGFVLALREEAAATKRASRQEVAA
jgi:acyl CoA:acetate/3-ketoacid CoA transferase beta subunit/acyl CoA:acetate/3-ketoacid CoA transferase alpha subunit